MPTETDAGTGLADARSDATTGDAGLADRAAVPDAMGTDHSVLDHSSSDRSASDGGLRDALDLDLAVGADAAVGTDAAVDDSAVSDRPDLDGTAEDTSSRPDRSFVDRQRPDAAPTNFYGVQWNPPQIMTTTVDAERCETDPVVTSDLRWLYLTRPAAAATDCYLDRRFHLFHWNNGVPIEVATLPKFESGIDENNPHPVDGVYAGHPGWQLFMHTAYLGTSGSQLRGVWLRGDPPAIVDGAPWPLANVNPGGSPGLTVPGDRMVFTRDGDLYESTGAPPNNWGSAVKLDSVSSPSVGDTDPALSADGRVLVFVRPVDATEDYDLWVARRSDPAGVFAAPELLPKAAGAINTDQAEMDAFITAAGDLLYMSNRSGTRRAYLARGFVP